MITLLHGDNQVESRNQLQALKAAAKNTAKEIISLDANRATLTDFIQALEAHSLFQAAKLVIVENLFSSRKSNREIIAYLKTGKFQPSVILWEPKKIDGRKIAWLKRRGKITNYAYPPVLFNLLDAIGASLQKDLLRFFRQAVRAQPIELVYYMIVRRFRLLLLVKYNATTAQIKETQRLQAWQLHKLNRQAAHFNLNELKKYYQKLLFIDYQQKTGRSALSLKQTLDIFLTQV